MAALGYFLAFLVSYAVDVIPVVSPPAWPFIVAMVASFDLSPWPAALLGVVGTTLGRYTLLKYIPRLGDRVFSRRQKENLEFLGCKLSGKKKADNTFVFLYGLTPLSTTALFTAAGLAKIPALNLLPGFVFAKTISYSFFVYLGEYAARTMSWKDFFTSWKGLVAGALALALLYAFLGLDWKRLFRERKLGFRFAFWR